MSFCTKEGGRSGTGTKEKREEPYLAMPTKRSNPEKYIQGRDKSRRTRKCGQQT